MIPQQDARQALIDKWRDKAAQCPPRYVSVANALKACADDLEALSASSASSEKPPHGPMVLGSWPKDCVQRAFVDGAAWWQFKANGATAWSLERDEMEAEAVRRFGEPASVLPDERRAELLRSTTRQSDDIEVTANDGAMFWNMAPLTSGELRALLGALSEGRLAASSETQEERSDLRLAQAELLQRARNLRERGCRGDIAKAHFLEEIVADLRLSAQSSPSQSEADPCPLCKEPVMMGHYDVCAGKPAETPEERKDAK